MRISLRCELSSDVKHISQEILPNRMNIIFFIILEKLFFYENNFTISLSSSLCFSSFHLS